jgi:uncharacterized protein (TIGR02117 family)
MRGLRRTLAALLATLAAYFAAATVGAILPNGQTGGGDGPVTVHLLAGPIHNDFLLPLDDETLADFAFVEAAGVPIRHPLAEWLVVGWGSRAFYTSTGSYADLSATTVLRATTGDASVMRVTLGAGIAPDAPVRPIRLSRAEYSALRAAILGSFSDRAALPGLHLSEPDAFFASDRPFDIFRTCNAWVDDMLAAAGIAFGRWTPTPHAVTLALRWHRS